ncbi:MAG: hypothetical protein WCK17_09835, partial [Verrucomicrobiota bacterium]
GKKWAIILGAIGGLAAVIVGVIFVTSKNDTPPTQKSSTTQPTAAKDVKPSKAPDSTDPYFIGTEYKYGSAGRSKDLKKAVFWFEKSALQGDQASQLELGLAYYKGEGVPVDYHKAAHWFTVLAEQGHVAAQEVLGKLHLSGELGEINEVEAYKWLDLASRSANLKDAEQSSKWRDVIAAQIKPAQLKEAKELVRKWKKKTYKELTEPDTGKLKTPSPTQTGTAASFDGQDVQHLLRTKYPNDAKLRSRATNGLRLIINGSPNVSPEAALETLESVSGGPLKDEADAAKVRVDIEQLFGAADRIGMSREDILKAAVESQERIHLMTKDILGADSRSHAASTANKFVVSAALALKQEQLTANKTASLGIKLGPERTLKQVLVYKENGHVHFMANYTAITMLQGGGAANNPSTKQKAQELLSDFEKTTNSIARRHFEIKARELIMEAEFGSPPSAKARRSKKQVIKFTPMPKNAIPETLTNPEPKKTPVHAPSLISHYKSIGFSEVEAEMFGSLYGEKAIEAAKALNLMASYYESRNAFDAERCMSWRYKAAKSGSSAAMFRLHQILHPNFALSFLGYPEGDAKQSLDWAIKAAEHGHADGMNAMGYYNWYGEHETDGGEVIMHSNKPQALVWWRKAAEAGSADAKAQIEKYRNGIPTTENISAPSRQPNTNPAANSKTPAASDVVLPNAALSALQIIKNGSLDEARECVRLLDEQLKRTPGNTRIEKVKNTIVNIFREEASLTSALNNRLAAENKLTVQTTNLEIASQPSGLTGQINQDSVQRGQRLVAETQTAITSADSTANDRRAKLRELLNSALDELPAPEGPALEPVWRKVAGRNKIPISK